MIDPNAIAGADQALEFAVFAATARRDGEFKQFTAVPRDSFRVSSRASA
jgi:hypothetical protein